jgi:signal transduction histidine kinase
VHALGDAWHSVGPALVLALFASGGPEWSSWPIYVAALGAQLFVDLTTSTARELLGRGVTPKIQLGVLAWVHLIDVVLAPVGLLAAFASVSQRYAFLLVLPLAALLVVLARERRARIENALDLSRAYRETSELNARLLDTERRARRQREHLIAGASHEMQTPLAVMLGLNEVLSNRDLPYEERAALHSAMERQLMLLRHLVRQFIDYTRLKSGDRLATDPRPARLAPIVKQVVDVQRGDTPFEVQLPEDLPPAVVDPARLREILMNLVSNAVKFSPPGAPVRITASSDTDSIELAVIDRGPGVRPSEEGEIFVETAESNADHAPGAGIGLYMARVLSESQGAELRVKSEPGRGSRFEVVLQRAE